MAGSYFYRQSKDVISIFFISLQKFAINCGKTAKTEQNIKKWIKEAFLRI